MHVIDKCITFQNIAFIEGSNPTTFLVCLNFDYFFIISTKFLGLWCRISQNICDTIAAQMEPRVIGAFCLGSDQEISKGSWKFRKSIYLRVGVVLLARDKWQKCDGGVPFANIQGTFDC